MSPCEIPQKPPRRQNIDHRPQLWDVHHRRDPQTGLRSSDPPPDSLRIGIAQDFPWEQCQGRFDDDKVVNECGKSDIWPVLAQSASWGYGASGTHGFGAVLVKDRFHARGHGQYFEPEFVEKYWEPFIRRGEYTGTDFEVRMPPTPWLVSVLGILPLQWASIVLVILLMSISLVPVCQGLKETMAQPTISNDYKTANSFDQTSETDSASHTEVPKAGSGTEHNARSSSDSSTKELIALLNSRFETLIELIKEAKASDDIIGDSLGIEDRIKYHHVHAMKALEEGKYILAHEHITSIQEELSSLPFLKRKYGPIPKDILSPEEMVKGTYPGKKPENIPAGAVILWNSKYKSLP